MAKHRKRFRHSIERGRDAPVVRPPAVRPLAALRPVAWSAVVGAAFAVMAAAPAHADPNTVPDPGSRPAPAGELRLPGSAPSQMVLPPAPVPGPLATQIMAAEAEVAILGEQLTSLNEQLAIAQATTSEAERAWSEAADQVAELRLVADPAAEEAYKAADELSPYGRFGSDILDLGRLLPRFEEPAEEPQITPWDVARAEEAERQTFRAYSDALLVEQGLYSQHATVDGTFKQKHAALLKLKTDNAQQLARIEAEREAYEQSQAGRYGRAGINVDGLAAHPSALRAVQFALAQLGKPYEWAAEGPNRFDCSGLMWASYRSVGITLPRVSRDQFRTTTPVSVDRLLPGDLVFFGIDRNDWTSIHHVGMYIGDGKMVHAPSTGDVVKISTVWWSRFFGATRVVGAVPAPVPPTTPPAPPPPVHTPPATTPPPGSTQPPVLQRPTGPLPTRSPAPPPASPTPAPTTSSPAPDDTATTPAGEPAPDDTATSPAGEPAPDTTETSPDAGETSPTSDATSPADTVSPSASATAV